MKGMSLEFKIQILDRLTTIQGATSTEKHFGIHEATVRIIKKMNVRLGSRYVREQK